MTTLSSLGESGVLELIDRRLQGRPAAALGTTGTVGPGDDASVTFPTGGLVATTDMIVAGQDFLPGWLAFPAGSYNVGVKAAAQNLADVFAMGAEPHGLLVSLGLEPEMTDAQLMGFYDGLLDECSRAGTGILGGDVGRADAMIVSITALGQLGNAAPLRRSGAMAGDGVYLAGTVGRAAAGLDLLMAGVRPGDVPDLDSLLAAQLAPRPDYATARSLPGWAHACIDASDGLAGDLGRVAAASAVIIDLDSAAVENIAGPLLPAAAYLCEHGLAEGDPGPLATHWVLSGGEDHGFLCTGPSNGTPTEPKGRPPVGLMRIGECSPAGSHGGMVRLDGHPVGDSGFRHFDH